MPLYRFAALSVMGELSAAATYTTQGGRLALLGGSHRQTRSLPALAWTHFAACRPPVKLRRTRCAPARLVPGSLARSPTPRVSPRCSPRCGLLPSVAVCKPCGHCFFVRSPSHPVLPTPAFHCSPAGVRQVLQQCYGDAAAVDDELVDIILNPGLQPGAVDVFLDFISYSSGPLPEQQLEVGPAGGAGSQRL